MRGAALRGPSLKASFSPHTPVGYPRAGSRPPSPVAILRGCPQVGLQVISHGRSSSPSSPSSADPTLGPYTQKTPLEQMGRKKPGISEVVGSLSRGTSLWLSDNVLGALPCVFSGRHSAEQGIQNSTMRYEPLAAVIPSRS